MHFKISFTTCPPFSDFNLLTQNCGAVVCICNLFSVIYYLFEYSCHDTTWEQCVFPWTFCHFLFWRRRFLTITAWRNQGFQSRASWTIGLLPLHRFQCLLQCRNNKKNNYHRTYYPDVGLTGNTRYDYFQLSSHRGRMTFHKVVPLSPHESWYQERILVWIMLSSKWAIL